jgi:multidrug efflux system outer membrane protein
MKKNIFLMNKIALLSVAALLTACQAVGPDYVRPENSLPANYAESAANSSASQVAINEWWTLFNDKTLNALVEQALKKHTDVQYAVARMEEADAYAREVGAATLPSVNFDADATRTRVTESGPFPVFAENPRRNYNFQFSSSFEIDFWGKVKRAKESARAQLFATKYARETVAWTLSSSVARNYLAFRSLEAQIAIAQSNLKSREESLALTKRRFEGGISSKLDVHQAEVAQTTLVADIAELKRQQANQLHLLATLTGNLELTLASAGSQLPIPPIAPAGLPSYLLENRPDIRQAEQQLVAMNANIGSAKAALYPSISLTGALGGESLALSDILKTASRVWSMGLDVTMPIFNSGRLSSRVDQASARQKQALAQYVASVRSAFQEVNDALVNVRQQAEREEALLQSAEAAKNALQISENRYRDGYSSYIEVLDAQRVYNDAARNTVLAHGARLVASVDLFKALGGGWDAGNK